jgi:MoaA/NifB/PqqE/SkfB family radical SAM enzyme
VKARNRDKDLSTDECKALIRAHFAAGMEVLEFTGGEPTIRRDLFELVRFAKETGFVTVSVITNGLRLAEPAYARELVTAGVSDFLFSIHGSTPEKHDAVTNVPGSHALLLRAIANVQGLAAKVRCNSVITGANQDDIYARAELLSGMGIRTLNFIMFNPIEQALESDERNFLRYSGAAAALKKAIDDFGPSFAKFTVRYMPFCLMRGYEAHIQNVPQVQYDHDEWDYYLRSYIREPLWKWLGGLAVGSVTLPHKGAWLRRGWDHFRHAAILQAHTVLHKSRPAQCRGCAYGFICGGVWKEYARRYGGGELRAEEGPELSDPWHFMTPAQRGCAERPAE